MMHRCPQCGREEEIIGKGDHYCLVCGVHMIRASGYKELWMSPCTVVARMQAIIEKHGYETAANGGRFKHEREAWTTGLYALGLSLMNEQEYWLEVETVDQTPDTRVHRIDQGSGHNVIMTQDVEVVDWVDHVDEIMTVVRQKCAKAYPPNFCLLVLVRNDRQIALDKVVEEISMLTVPFAEIWLIGRSTEELAIMVRLFPGFLRFAYKLHDACERTKTQRAFIQKQKRGSSTEFRDLGICYLPIP